MLKREKLGLLISFLLLASFLLVGFDFVSASSSDCKLYKQYKKEYDNKTDKKYYLRIKGIKDRNLSLYSEYRETYEKYKKYRNADLKKLDKSIQKTFKVYESYRGYKDFRYYKDKCLGLNPDDDSYNIIYQTDGNGYILGDAKQRVKEGSSGALVTAAPNTGFHFVSWNDGRTEASRFEANVLIEKTFTASFFVNNYSLNYTSGTGGSIQGFSNQTANYGSNGSMVTAVPNSGYRFTGWSDGNTNASRTDTNVTENISVTASFVLDNCSLTYTASAHGLITGSTSQTVNYGSNGTEVTAIPDSNYHFVSWSDGNTNASRTDSNVTGNISVTANFAIDTYAITFNGNTSDGGSTAAQILDYNTPTALTANGYTKTGYTFAGWATTAGGSVAYADGASYTIGAANVTLYAKWTINTYILTYTADSNGSITGTSPQTVNHGSSGSQVTAVPNSGYHFTSWSDGVLTAARTDTNVTQNISVTASFVADSATTYTLTYTAGAHGSISGTTPQTVTEGEDGSAVTAVPSTGYHFVSWSDASTANPRTDTDVSGNISVTASFAINTYTVTFNKNGGDTEANPTTKTADYNGNVGTLPTAPTRTNYSFNGWNTASNGSGTSFTATTAVTANITVYAQWTINSYTLTYTAGSNGSITGTSPQTVNHGSNGSQVTAVPSSGYHFTSWSDGVLTASRTDTNVTGNITVTASFEADVPNTYTLTYTAGSNGSITGSSPQTVTEGNDGTAVTAVPSTGYHFVSWSDASTANPRTDTDVSGNISVTASFAINTYTVTFNKNGGDTEANPTTKTADYNGNVGTLPTAPTRANYSFNGWNTVSNGSGTSFTATTAVTANITVYAQWTINSYTLTYTAGSGGSVTGASPQTVNGGSSGTEVTAVPDTGRHFVQWSDGILTATRTDTNVSGNISVTAEFAINTYTLTYSAGTGGTISGTSPQTVNFGANGSTVTAVPSSGYHFVEWSDHINTAAREDLNISANLSVSAVFAINSVVTVTAINPTTGYNTDSVDLTSITGTGFMSGATVKLTKTGQSDVPCTGFTVASSTSITGGSCHITLAAAGSWNVVVTNSDTGSGSLSDGFTVQEYAVGSTGPAGGLIFYVNSSYETDGWRYLEAAPTDQCRDDLVYTVRWWNNTSTLIGGTSTAIGAGLSNTNTIVGGTTPVNDSAIALAYNYSIGGYGDWFLPSQEELNLMLTNLYRHSPSLGGFTATGYWSSSEDTATNAMRRTFSGVPDYPESKAKTTSYRVRAARRFSTTTTYDVAYNGNGSTGGTAPTDSNHYPANNQAVVLGEGDLVRDGHKFMGWNTAANGSGTTYQAGETLTLGSADVTLYAIWKVDFYISVFPDTQSSVNWKPSVLTSQIDWLINNKDILDLRFVGHVGDLVAEWENDATEWTFAQNEFGQLKTAGIPYSLLPGNHDYAYMTRTSTLLNSYFPLSNFSSMSTYGGAYDAHSDNTYHIVDVGGKKLLILSLEFGPRDAVVTWANGILQANSDKKAIVITHAYINTDGALLADGMDHAASNGYNLGADVNDGDDLWNDLIYPNNNVAFVICGHDGTSADGSGLRESTHANGAPVHQILSNYQYYSPVANGSYFLLFHFKDDTVEMRTYSSYLNQYKTDSESQQDYAWSF